MTDSRDTDMQQEYNQREGWTVSMWVKRADGQLWTDEQINKINAIENVSTRTRTLSKISLRVETTIPVRWVEDSHDMAAKRGAAVIIRMLQDLGYESVAESEDRSASWSVPPAWLFKK